MCLLCLEQRASQLNITFPTDPIAIQALENQSFFCIHIIESFAFCSFLYDGNFACALSTMKYLPPFLCWATF